MTLLCAGNLYKFEGVHKRNTMTSHIDVSYRIHAASSVSDVKDRLGILLIEMMDVVLHVDTD